MKIKKRIIFLIILIIILLISISLTIMYLINANQKIKGLEKALENPALDYFDKYVSASSVASSYKITLEMLNKANEAGENYNLNALNDCDDKTTYALVTIDYSNGEVIDMKFKLNCKTINFPFWGIE